MVQARKAENDIPAIVPFPVGEVFVFKVVHSWGAFIRPLATEKSIEEYVRWNPLIFVMYVVPEDPNELYPVKCSLQTGIPNSEISASGCKY